MLTHTPTRTLPRTPARPGRGGIALAVLALVAAGIAAPTAPADAATAPYRVGPPQAAALGGGAECPPGQTNCDVWDDDPGQPGGPGGGGDGGGNGGGGGDDGPRKCVLNGKPVRCYDDVLGWFSSSDGCYYKLQEPQPPGTPEGKQWYLRTCLGSDVGSQEPVLLDAPPPGFGAPPDPEELARTALASITLKRPRVGIAPRPRNGAGLVGLPVWLWTSSDAGTWGPLSASASDRGLTVTISARVQKIVWDMGNGVRQTCYHPGVPYDGQGGPSPKCGYDGYPRSSGDGKYKVFATTYWEVPWQASSGESGTIYTTRVSQPVWIEIDELQVVTR